MAGLDRLNFGFRARLPVILQTESAECGLACLAMVGGYYGHDTNLTDLRSRYPISAKGATLGQIMRIARHLKLMARPIRTELEGLQGVRLPCVLHWQHMHFVVLKSISAREAWIHDPASGAIRVSLKRLSECFTGVVLELWPDEGFQAQSDSSKLRLRDLFGRVAGIGSAVWRVLALALALEVTIVALPAITQLIIDAALVSGSKELLNVLGVAALGLVVTQVTIKAARTWATVFMGTEFNLQWRANVFSHLLRLPASYFEKRHLGDLSNRFYSIDQIQQTATVSFVESLLDGLFVAVTILIMSLYNGALAMVALASALLYLSVRTLSYSPLYKASQLQLYFQGKQQSYFLESMRGIKSVKLFGREEQRHVVWMTALVDYFNASIRVQRLDVFFEMAKTALSNAGKVAILWIGATMVMGGALTLGGLVAFIAYATLFDQRVSNLVDNLLKIKVLRLHADRLSDILLTTPEQLGDFSGPTSTATTAPSLEVRDLRFSYAEGEPEVLSGVNFRVEPGESVAIAGPSGGGKTTLVNVILGVLPATSGEILVDGRSVREIGSGTLRQMAGVVLQDDSLFAGSIADNISFFDAEADMTRILESAALARIHEEITRMPMGYNTYIGDMGSVLSGGQKQRVLLARALYKQPKLLILDEATSHLDVIKEKEVNAAIRALKLTVLIVAHRPETIASVDRCLYLKDGRVVDRSTISAE